MFMYNETVKKEIHFDNLPLKFTVEAAANSTQLGYKKPIHRPWAGCWSETYLQIFNKQKLKFAAITFYSVLNEMNS